MPLTPNGFCPDYYLDLYVDVVAVYGRDHGNAERHYRQSGIDEGRSPNPFFVPQFYLDCYPDLREAFGVGGYRSALRHWLECGIREGRAGSQNFDPQFYLAEHPDLQSAFGSDYVRAYRHWLDSGIGEGRRSSESQQEAGKSAELFRIYQQKPSFAISFLLSEQDLLEVADLLVARLADSALGAARLITRDEESAKSLASQYEDDSESIWYAAYTEYTRLRETRHPDESWYPERCGTCRARLSIRDIKYYYMTDQRWQGYWHAASSFLAVKNLAGLCISAATDMVLSVVGERRKSTKQSTCTKCMSIYSRCPYCRFMNRHAERIPVEHLPHTCTECKKRYEIVIYNDTLESNLVK